MSRLFLLLAIAIVVVLLYRGLRMRKQTRQAAALRSAPQNMIRCEYCGTHIPQDRAVIANGHPYCCEAHRASAQSAGQ